MIESFKENQKFQTPEDEIRFLREQISEKENQLEKSKEIFTQQEIVKEKIVEYREQKPEDINRITRTAGLKEKVRELLELSDEKPQTPNEDLESEDKSDIEQKEDKIYTSGEISDAENFVESYTRLLDKQWGAYRLREFKDSIDEFPFTDESKKDMLLSTVDKKIDQLGK